MSTERHVSFATAAEGGASAPVAADKGTPTAQPKKAAPAKPATQSTFTVIRDMLDSVDAVKEFVSKNQQRLNDPHQLQLFLQGLSNKAFYMDLFASAPNTTRSLLNLLLSLPTKMKWKPFAHEFCLRAEQAYKNSPEATVDREAEGNNDDEPALLSINEMLDSLRLRDPVGRLMRKIELCQSLKDIRRCATAFVEEPFKSAMGNHQYSMLLAKLLSKTRSLCVEQRGIVLTQHTLDVLFEAINAASRCHVTIPGKFNHFVSWAKSIEGSSLTIPELSNGKEIASASDQQTESLSLVLEVKQCDTPAALAAILGTEDVVSTEDERLRIHSPDVLSSLAVAATKWIEATATDENAAAVCAKVAQLFAKVRKEGVPLPRRASRFLAAFDSKQKNGAGPRKRLREEEPDHEDGDKEEQSE